FLSARFQSILTFLAFLGVPHLLHAGLAHIEVSGTLTMGHLNLLGIHRGSFLGLRLRPLGRATGRGGRGSVLDGPWGTVPTTHCQPRTAEGVAESFACA